MVPHGSWFVGGHGKEAEGGREEGAEEVQGGTVQRLHRRCTIPQDCTGVGTGLQAPRAGRTSVPSVPENGRARDLARCLRL